MKTVSSKHYLKNGRLSDVITLIKVLASSSRAYNSLEGINTLMHSPSGGEACWLGIAKQHPEFFRVAQEEKTAALIGRGIQYHRESESVPLSPSETATLLNLAVSLHDHELRRRQRWIPVASLIIGLLTLATVLASSVLL